MLLYDNLPFSLIYINWKQLYYVSINVTELLNVPQDGSSRQPNSKLDALNRYYSGIMRLVSDSMYDLDTTKKIEEVIDGATVPVLSATITEKTPLSGWWQHGYNKNERIPYLGGSVWPRHTTAGLFADKRLDTTLPVIERHLQKTDKAPETLRGLDMGCGSGVISREIARLVIPMDAVDINPLSVVNN